MEKEPCLTISSCSIVKVIDCEKVDPAKFLDLRIELVMESLSYQPRKSKLGKACERSALKKHTNWLMPFKIKIISISKRNLVMFFFISFFMQKLPVKKNNSTLPM